MNDFGNSDRYFDFSQFFFAVILVSVGSYTIHVFFKNYFAKMRDCPLLLSNFFVFIIYEKINGSFSY